jgi:hypothetical protein
LALKTEDSFLPLSDHVWCLGSEESYQELYGFLTGQAGVPLPELGRATQILRKGVEPLNFRGIRLPKLPEADVKAVGRSLPGKLLGRTAALVSLVLLVLFVAGLVDFSLKQLLRVDLSRSPWLHYGLLFGLPLLAVVSQLLVEWRAERTRRALQRLAVRIGAEQSGYFRIGPYLDTAGM